MKLIVNAIVGGVLMSLPTRAQSLVWTRDLGLYGTDWVGSAAPDGAGGVYVGGGWGLDAWLARYDSAGSQAWISGIGTSGLDQMSGLAADGTGGVFVGGSTDGSLGGPSLGSYDAWIARYDGAGNQIWIRQIGTGSEDRLYCVAPDGSGGAYVGGYTAGSLGVPNAGQADAWIARIDGAGNQVWIRQFGTNSVDSADCFAADGSGGIFVGGVSSGSLGGPSQGGFDAWLAHYDGAGNQVWIRQFGTSSEDRSIGAAPDGSAGVYVSGESSGNLGGSSAGGKDPWLAHYDGLGNQNWIRQFGTTSDDYLGDAASDGAGGVYLVGTTWGSLGGPSAGNRDAWFAQFDGAGNRIWILQRNLSVIDQGYAIAACGTAGLYVGGLYFNSPPVGDNGWLARYDLPCGLDFSFCTAGTTTNGCAPSMSGAGSASASAGSGFSISISHVEGQRTGLIFYGTNNSSWSPLPWASGSTSFLRVKPPTQRTVAQSSGGTSGACDGTLSIDWNAFIAANPGVLGTPFTGTETVYAQGWFRDPAAPKTTNLSNALQFSVCP